MVRSGRHMRPDAVLVEELRTGSADAVVGMVNDHRAAGRNLAAADMALDW